MTAEDLAKAMEQFLSENIGDDHDVIAIVRNSHGDLCAAWVNISEEDVGNMLWDAAVNYEDEDSQTAKADSAIN